MKDKLIVALDVADIKKAQDLVMLLGDEVEFYKIGLEFMASGDYFTLIKWLKHKNKKVFADLKLFDISQTVAKAVSNLKQYEIDLLTIHCASRDIMLRAAENKGNIKIIGVTILTNLAANDLWEMGFDKNLSIEQLVLHRAKLALNCGLDGVVSSPLEVGMLRQNLGNNFLVVTPGIRLEKIHNDDQKRAADAAFALQNGSSYLVVGRPITQAQEPKLSAQKFNQIINETLTNINANHQ